MDSINKFWMVWCTTRGGPVYQHSTKQSARREAERLAHVCPGQTFIVLAAVDAVKCEVSAPQQLKIKKAPIAVLADGGDTDDGIPF
jgi:hypothetical protein